MKVVGITGSIGMGKSTIARIVRLLGFPVFDADAMVKSFLQEDRDVIESVKALFPTVVEHATVNRALLADIIYAEPEALRALEEILHPRVRIQCLSFMEEQKGLGFKVVFLDIPLLYEKGFDMLVDWVWLAWCDPKIRLKRVMARSHLTVERIEKISHTQMNDAMKTARADCIIDTSFTKVETFRQVVRALQSVCAQD